MFPPRWTHEWLLGAMLLIYSLRQNFRQPSLLLFPTGESDILQAFILQIMQLKLTSGGKQPQRWEWGFEKVSNPRPHWSPIHSVFWDRGLRKVHLWQLPGVLLTQQARRGIGTRSEDIRWSREMGNTKLLRLNNRQSFWPSDYELNFKLSGAPKVWSIPTKPYVGKVRINNSETGSRSPNHKEENNIVITGSKEVTVDCGQG